MSELTVLARVKLARAQGLMVFWNDGQDRWLWISSLEGSNAFFQKMSQGYVDLHNVALKDLLFLQRSEVLD